MLSRNRVHSKNIALLLATITCFGASALRAQSQFPWPVTPFDQTHEITGSFAEYRDTGSSDHFHNGTDIPKADGSPVYPVKDGLIRSLSASGSNAFVRVDDMAYVHIRPNPSLSIGDPVVASQTVLGTILSGQGHVHFTNGFVGSENNSLLANSGLTPYSDPWPPIIRFVRFYQNNTGVLFQNNKLSGLVDIMVKVDEQNGPSGSALSRRNNGTYKIGYKVLSADSSTVIFEPPNDGLRFQFDTKPSNSFVTRVFFQQLSSTTSHVYQVTNDVARDNFWNTASLPEDKYVVMAFSEDTRGNTDTAYVSVTTTEADLEPPAQPVFRNVVETETGFRLSWRPNSDEDLAGYRLFFSFDNVDWSLFRDEGVLTAGVADTVIPGILRRDVYFKLTAVDDAPVPNTSLDSDVYGMSNGDFDGKILIVDGFDRTDGGWTDPSHSFAFTIGRHIIANNYSFDTVANEVVASGATDLNAYDGVFWLLGDESSADETFSAAEQVVVKSYLETGGNLFATGSDIAWDLDNDSGSDSTTAEDDAFVNSYLKTQFAADDAEATRALGVSGSIFDGTDLDFGLAPYVVAAPDVFLASEVGAVPCLTYPDGSVAGIQYQGPLGNGFAESRLVILAFPFETIAGDEARTQIVARVLGFFANITAVRAADDRTLLPRRFQLGRNYPNPFNPGTTIDFDLPESSDVTMTVHNLLGQVVRRLLDEPMAAGSHTVDWQGRDQAGRTVGSGVYLVRFSASQGGSGQPFQQARRILLIK